MVVRWDVPFDEVVQLAARVLEGAGVTAMIAGTLIALILAVSRWRRGGALYRGLRQDLGRGILLGLELLVGADILRTVAEKPTLYQVGVLAGIVAIRTWLSFSLEVELTGRWPWRGGNQEDGRQV